MWYYDDSLREDKTLDELEKFCKKDVGFYLTADEIEQYYEDEEELER